MRLKPTLRYQMRDYLTGVLSLAGVILALVIFMGAMSVFYGGENYFQGNSFIAFVFLLVSGIATPREHLRVGVQMGVSRRTSFLGVFLCPILVALIMSLLSELLVISFHTIPVLKGIHSADLYSMVYLEGKAALSPAQHGTSILFHWALLFAAFTLGLFITILFWRLNRTGTIIAAVGIPVLIFAIPGAIYRFQTYLAPLVNVLDQLVQNCLHSPWFTMLLALICAAILILISWLLLRRANIQGT